MLPPFDDNGYLPAGIHPATMEEIATRFGTESELRRAEMDSVRWMVDAARKAGVVRIILNGSFVTNVLEPDDVDCVLLVGAGYPKDAAAGAELEAGFPFIGLSLVPEKGFKHLTEYYYASAREFIPKGMAEVIP